MDEHDEAAGVRALSRGSRCRTVRTTNAGVNLVADADSFIHADCYALADSVSLQFPSGHPKPDSIQAKCLAVVVAHRFADADTIVYFVAHHIADADAIPYLVAH